MGDFNLNELQPYLFILMGRGGMLAALKVNGGKAEGIIYALEQKESSCSSTYGNSNIRDKATIRFLTKDQQ